MTNGKERTVFLLEAYVSDGTSHVADLPRGWWQGLHTHVTSLDGSERTAIFANLPYEGEASSVTPGRVDYFYIGKSRLRSDWPDATDSDGRPTNWDEVEIAGLKEYAYILPVGDTAFMAMFRSTGGPSFSAIEEWLSRVTPSLGANERIGLRPYTRKDSLERLAQARGATKVELKMDPSGFENGTPGRGELGSAMSALSDIGYGEVSVEVAISFGHATPSDVGAEQVAKELKKILGNPGITRAKGTILASGEDGTLRRDKVDFIRDRVTLKVEVGTSRDDAPTPSTAVSALAEAVRNFQTHNRLG